MEIKNWIWYGGLAIVVICILCMGYLSVSDTVEKLKPIDCNEIAKQDWNITNLNCKISYPYGNPNTCFCYKVSEPIKCIDWDIKNNSKVCLEYNYNTIDALKISVENTNSVFNFEVIQ